MRTFLALPVVAAIMLSACGSNDETAEGGVTAEHVASEAEDIIKPKAGQYRTTVELMEFDAPGMPASAKQQMEQVLASGFAEGNTFCMTEEEAAKNGAREMVQNLAESNCEISKFDVNGQNLTSEMQCAGEGGGVQSVKMDGTMTAERSDMTMEMKQEMPNVGLLNMKMRVKSERIGNCA